MRHMSRFLMAGVIAAMLGGLGVFGIFGGTFSGATALAADPMSEKEAKPGMKERLVEKTVKGDVLRIDGEQLVVRDSDGKEVRLHVDHSTKMDKVIAGDKVKAYYTEQGHATTLQRLER